MTETAKTEKRQPTSDLSTDDIWTLYSDPMVGTDFFEVIESYGVAPSELEFLGDDTVKEYEQWIYGNIK